MAAPIPGEIFSQQSTKRTLYTMPTDPLLHIMSFLDYSDLVSICRTCRRLNELAGDEQIWKSYCKRYWLQKTRPGKLTWKQHFKDWYRDYGKYIDCYADLRHAWNIIEGFIDKYDLMAKLNDGTNEHVLNDIERIIGHTLPADVRCSYRMHNGDGGHGQFGILGSIASYLLTEPYTEVQNYSTSCLHMMSPAAMRERLQSSQMPGLFPITFCPFSLLSQAVVVDECSGLSPGQIVTCCMPYIHPSQVDSMDSADLQDCFVMGNSFKQWFCDYADNLEKERFVVKGNEIFRYFRDPTCVAITRDVKVEVATCFMPNVSSIEPMSLIYAYHVTLSMSEDVNPMETCRLLRRHWIITDEEDQEKHVDGSGVVGKYPVVSPGSTFDYVSCTVMKTTHGNMQGIFTMLNLKSGEEYEIVVPTFHLRSPPQVTRQDRILRQNISKKNK